MEITPVTRSMAKVIGDKGELTYRCYSPTCPPFFKSSAGTFLPMEHGALSENLTTTGGLKADLRNKRLVSVGIRQSSGYDKCVGFRYDDCQDGSEQLE